MKEGQPKRYDRERTCGHALYNRGTLNSSSVRRQGLGKAGHTDHDCKFKIAHWNCRSVCQEDFLDTLTETMIKRKISLIALNETHLRGSDTRECCENFTLAHSGVDENAKRTEKGVGFLFDSSVRCFKFIAHSPRNCVGWFEICGAKLKLVSTYTPTENADENEYAEYLEELTITLSEKVDLKYDFSLIVLGDFKAAIGSENSALMPKIVGSHNIGDESSRNGMLLSEWCLERNLRIENTFFQKPALRACTWRHPRTGELSLKDYVIISAGKGKTSLSIDDTRSSWGDSYQSDHAMLIVVGSAKAKEKGEQKGKTQKS